MSATTLLDPVPAVPPAAGTAPALVQARDLTRVWGKGHAAQIGVSSVDLDIAAGEIVAVIGPSGSGKSTLGALIAGIDQPTSGSLVVNGTRIDRMKTDKLAAWRGANVGIVFQDFHLLPTLTAAENVELAIELGPSGAGRRLRRRAARKALDAVGLGDFHKKLPAQMSGGEQQRVGIARAMVTHPPIIVADEPTGSLDQSNGHAVFELLMGLARNGSTVVFITHDLALADGADRVVSMIDGRVDAVTQRSAGGGR
ncbi:MAG: ABC transporter ATP-binding protein [Ilumatobacter sp.]|uniref:ABC transporter ATP-binding protein n=1 Tax=Ilumatobacter sp. TaxID=1967498 RepID=UPI0026078D84|nr:ABC transporter ATP-binding protein [Ilumatobacter sp.]MDJ0769302.1 ABC transporter ATP-binding protein [Ilumatobacter sp.]